MSIMTDPVIMHIDMDAFFAAVEEKANPDLKGKPLAVAGPGERSIVTTASYTARSFGVRTGMTVFQAKSFCKDLSVIKADYRKYAHASKMVMDTLETFTPRINVLSVDEAFLEISDLVDSFDSAENLGRKVMDKVNEITGLTCSVGIAPGRLLAKLASAMDKPNGLTVILPEKITAILETLPVGKLCGIGPATVEKLNLMGITTCGQLSRCPLEMLEKKFGKMGADLSRMGKGFDPSGNPLLSGKAERVRSVGHSVTLPKDLKDRESMERVLLTLSEMAGRRLRQNNGCAACITLTCRYDDFSTFTRRQSLECPIYLTIEIYERSLSIFNSIDLIRPVRLLGLSLSELTFGMKPMCLLEEDQKRTRIQKALDAVNDRFGEFSLTYAGTVDELRKIKVISPAWRNKGIKCSS